MKLINNTKLRLVLVLLLITLISIQLSYSFESNKSSNTRRTNELNKNKHTKNKNKKTSTKKTRDEEKDKKVVTAEEVEKDNEKGPDTNPKGAHSFFTYDPRKSSHLLILDNSVSLKNKYEKDLTRRKVVQNILNSYKKEGYKVNFCAASPLSTNNKWRVIFKWQVLPPVLKYKSPITFLGIKKCLNRVAKLEKKLGRQVFTNIHIVTDGYYLANRELPNLIRFLAPGKSYSADLIGNDVESITVIKKWISKINGKNVGIRYRFGEIFKD
jgi:hypothetical protein